MKKPAWSYSALNEFMNCPLKYRLKTTKQTVEKESEEMKWGNTVHKALEKRVMSNTPLPEHLAYLEEPVSRIAKQEGKFGERRIAIDGEFKPVTFFDSSVWCRGVIDVGVKKGKTVWAADYKSGKRRPGSDQLQLFAALLFHTEPDIQEVKTSYIWIKESARIDTETYRRDDLPKIWQHFLPKVARLEAAYEKNEWQAKPNALCSWCPASKSQCEFSRKEGRDE